MGATERAFSRRHRAWHGQRRDWDAIARNNHLPFASADSITLQRDALEAEFQKLRLAQMQHRLVVDALQQRESARAESLVREHANIGLRYGTLFGLSAAPHPAQPALPLATMPTASPKRSASMSPDRATPPVKPVRARAAISAGRAPQPARQRKGDTQAR